jgi:hypothetical protein
MILTVEPRSNCRESCLSVTYFTRNLAWTDLGQTPALEVGGQRLTASVIVWPWRKHPVVIIKTKILRLFRKIMVFFFFFFFFFFRSLEVKFILWHTMKAHKWLDVHLYPFLIFCTRWGFVVKATIIPFYSEKEIRCPIYRGLCGSRCRSGRVQKYSVPSVIEPRNLQHITSHQINYFIPTALCEIYERLEKYSIF